MLGFSFVVIWIIVVSGVLVVLVLLVSLYL